MKTIRLILLTSLLLLTIYGQSKEVFNQATSAYQNQNYEDAVQLYQSLVNDGFAGGELYYNLGNAYFKMDKLGLSILYYEKALKYSPGDEDILHNLAIANARTVDKIKEVPNLFLVDWFNYYLALFPVLTWTLILYVSFLSLLFSIGGFLLSRRLRYKRPAFFSTIVTLVLTLLLSITLYAKIDQETTSHYGVLITPNISVKNSPDFNSNDAFIINEGIKFEIEDTVNNWGRIKLSDGKVGWLPKSAYEKI